MDKLLISDSHQPAPWAWFLDGRQATTLAATAVPRWLRVDEGCVWITAQHGDANGDDIWLGAGDSLALPAGSAWVVEAWPQARLSLLQAAPVALSRGAVWQRAWQAWRRATLPVFSTTPSHAA